MCPVHAAECNHQVCAVSCPWLPSPHTSNRYYFYGQQSGSGALLLAEVVVRTDSRLMSVTIKSDAPELVPQFVELWGNCFMGFCR